MSCVIVRSSRNTIFGSSYRRKFLNASSSHGSTRPSICGAAGANNAVTSVTDVGGPRLSATAMLGRWPSSSCLIFWSHGTLYAPISWTFVRALGGADGSAPPASAPAIPRSPSLKESLYCSASACTSEMAAAMGCSMGFTVSVSPRR